MPRVRGLLRVVTVWILFCDSGHRVMLVCPLWFSGVARSDWDQAVHLYYPNVNLSSGIWFLCVGSLSHRPSPHVNVL